MRNPLHLPNNPRLEAAAGAAEARGAPVALGGWEWGTGSSGIGGRGSEGTWEPQPGRGSTGVGAPTCYPPNLSLQSRSEPELPVSPRGDGGTSQLSEDVAASRADGGGAGG